MKRPLLLDLFCGAGGAAMGYHRAGFDVVGVDMNPQPHYPFEFHQADAMSYPLDGYDAVHASPPCQHYSSRRTVPNAREHPDLVAATRKRLDGAGVPWVIENVVGAPLEIGQPNLFNDRSGIVLCGSMFSLTNSTHELRRHRLFESNVPMPQPACRHRMPTIGFVGDHARDNANRVKEWPTDITGNARKMPLVRDLMGIDWMTWSEAVLAIPPAYTEWIGAQLLDHIKVVA